MVLLLALSTVGYGAEDSLLLESAENGERASMGREPESESQENGEAAEELWQSERADDNGAAESKAAETKEQESSSTSEKSGVAASEVPEQEGDSKEESEREEETHSGEVDAAWEEEEPAVSKGSNVSDVKGAPALGEPLGPIKRESENTNPTVKDSAGNAVGAAPQNIGGAQGAASELQSQESAKSAKVSEKDGPYEKAVTQDGVGAKELSVPGAYGWGLGLSFPISGPVAGLGSDSRPGAGYHLGGVLSLEVIPRFELRLGVHQTGTYGGRATIHYADGNTERFSRVDSEWIDIVVMGGVAYLHRDLDWPWIPFFGFDFGLSFHGYYYELPSELSTLPANDTATQFLEGGQDGLTLGWRATFRVGGRLSLTKWLETSLEFAIDYTSLTDEEPVSNTVVGRKVQTLGEDVFLFRLVFAVWMGV